MAGSSHETPFEEAVYGAYPTVFDDGLLGYDPTDVRHLADIDPDDRTTNLAASIIDQNPDLDPDAVENILLALTRMDRAKMPEVAELELVDFCGRVLMASGVSLTVDM